MRNLWGVKFAIEFVIYQDTKGREAHEQVRNGLLFRQVLNFLKNHGTRDELCPEVFQNLTFLTKSWFHHMSLYHFLDSFWEVLATFGSTFVIL